MVVVVVVVVVGCAGVCWDEMRFDRIGWKGLGHG